MAPNRSLDPRRRCRLATALVCLVLMTWPLAASSDEVDGPIAGQSLAEGLETLRGRGLDIFFTSHLVRPGMTVETTPTATEPRKILAQLLAPHGLRAVPGPGGRLVVIAGEPSLSGVRGVVRSAASGAPIPGAEVLIPGTLHVTRSDDDGRFELVEVPHGRHALEARLPGFVVAHLDVDVEIDAYTMVPIDLEPAPMSLDEIVVTPSRVSLLREDPVTALALDRDDIFALPQFGDDIFRALTLMPGVTGEETSAAFNVRGGRTDEVLVLLDRLELFEPYHLKDFGSRVSIVPPRTLREVELITGGFPARYGDRMSGVLDMSTSDTTTHRWLVGVGLLNTELGGSGTFADGRGRWLGSLRRSNLDLALDLLDIREQPKYWGGFAKLAVSPNERRHVGVHALATDDSLDFSKVELLDDAERFVTSYGNDYVWLTHQEIASSRLFVDSTLSIGRVERDRRGTAEELDPDEAGNGFQLIDRRRLDVVGLKQDWSFRASDDHSWHWGFEAREFDTTYDYFSNRVLDDPLESIRSEPRTGTTRFVGRLRGESFGVYASDRFRPRDDLVIEVGVRYDEQTLTGDRDVSPRVNMVWSFGRGNLRAAWGHFYQSQRPYELQVEDGITTLSGAERTEQRVVGFERGFERPGRSDLFLRVEAYQRLITDPRARYENIYEPTSVFPEIEPDRFLVRPESAEAWGVEIFLRGSIGPVDLWGSYTHARIFDQIDGRDVPRRFDQPHALTLDAGFQAGDWNINFAWRYHTGWPTTALFGVIEEDDEGELDAVPAFGPFNDERLADYHRLDVRLSREWSRPSGSLGFFLEIQNVYDRRNIAGFDPDFDLDLDDEGRISLALEEEVWDGFLPSFGVTWEF